MVNARVGGRALDVGHGRAGIERDRYVQRIDLAVGHGRRWRSGIGDTGRNRGRIRTSLTPSRGVNRHRRGSAVVLLRVERLDVLPFDPVAAYADVLAVRRGGPAVVHQVVEG